MTRMNATRKIITNGINHNSKPNFSGNSDVCTGSIFGRGFNGCCNAVSKTSNTLSTIGKVLGFVALAGTGAAVGMSLFNMFRSKPQEQQQYQPGYNPNFLEAGTSTSKTVSKAESQAATAGSELDAAVAKYESAEAGSQEQKTMKIIAEKEIAQSQQQMERLTPQIKKADEQVAKYDEKIKTTQGEIEKEGQIIEELTPEIAKLEDTTIPNLESELKTLKNSLSTAPAEKKAEIQKNINTKEQEIKTAKDNLKQKQDARDAATKRVEKLQEKLETYTTQKEAAKAEADALKEAKAGLQEKITDARTALSKASTPKQPAGETPQAGAGAGAGAVTPPATGTTPPAAGTSKDNVTTATTGSIGLVLASAASTPIAPAMGPALAVGLSAASTMSPVITQIGRQVGADSSASASASASGAGTEPKPAQVTPAKPETATAATQGGYKVGSSINIRTFNGNIQQGTVEKASVERKESTLVKINGQTRWVSTSDIVTEETLAAEIDAKIEAAAKSENAEVREYKGKKIICNNMQWRDIDNPRYTGNVESFEKRYEILAAKIKRQGN